MKRQQTSFLAQDDSLIFIASLKFFFTSLYPRNPAKVVRTIICLVVFLMFLDIVGAAVTTLPTSSDHALTIHTSKSKCWMLISFLFEKSEEESENEEETESPEEGKDTIDRIILQYFSRIAASRSFYYAPRIRFAALTFQYDVRPHLHEFNCVFLI
jgi:hypothetical protein